MKRAMKILVIIIAASAIYSVYPLISLYIASDPVPVTNRDAIIKLNDNKGGHFEFIVLGDNHAGLPFNDSSFLKMIRHINREDRFKKAPIDFVMISGDITDRGSAWDYKAYNKLRSLIKWPVISAVGNHDNDNEGEARFKKYVGDTEFSFADRNSYFIALNNENGNLTERQLALFEEELKKSASYAHRFVIVHKAPLSLYQQSWFRPELNSWAYPFIKLCEKYKVDICFSGHEHIFKEAVLGGVKYMMSGGGGMLIQYPERDGGYLHYVVVRVYGDYIDYEVRRVFPPLWEYLTYYIWKEVFYFLRGVVF